MFLTYSCPSELIFSPTFTNPYMTGLDEYWRTSRCVYSMHLHERPKQVFGWSWEDQVGALVKISLYCRSIVHTVRTCYRSWGRRFGRRSRQLIQKLITCRRYLKSPLLFYSCPLSASNLLYHRGLSWIIWLRQPWPRCLKPWNAQYKLSGQSSAVFSLRASIPILGGARI